MLQTSINASNVSDMQVVMGKVWFVTGSSKGIGRTIVEAALEQGDTVVATARNPEDLATLEQKYGDRVLPYKLDVSDYGQVVRVVEEVAAKFKVDVVVNNAGYAKFELLEDCSIESFEAQVQTNFLGTVYVTKTFIPHLRKQQSGHFIQIASVGSRITTPALSAYQSAKWAVEGFSLSVAQEVELFGIKMTVIEPGAVQTDWSSTSLDAAAPSEPYKEIRSKILQIAGSTSSSSPRNVAQVVLKVAEEAEPPLRLLVGKDAVMYWDLFHKGYNESDAKWKELSVLEA